MDALHTLWTFISSMTIWQWMALIAFILLPFSALNAILSLKTKYRDWQGIRSKVKFEKRLKELTGQIKKIAGYRERPLTLLLMSQETLLSSGVLILISFLLCIVGFVLPPIDLFFFAIAGFFVVSALGQMQVSAKLVKDTNVPEEFANHVLAFVEEGKRKGFISKDDNTMRDMLLGFHLITTEGKRAELLEYS